MTAIWKRPLSVELLNSIHVDTTVAHLGIEFLEVGDDFIRARAPVDARTRQPMGISAWWHLGAVGRVVGLVRRGILFAA